MIITRFAPSPTGELHIGSVRTALFSYLFTKNQKGKFLLRIEDTDRERYVEGSAERIKEALKWLGLEWDKKELVQSKRLDIYKKHALKLIKEDKAYICTCSKEKLMADRNEQIQKKQPPKYRGHCRSKNIKIDDVKEGEYVIRMKMPTGGGLIFNDLIKGKIEFDLSLLDDQIILKSDGYPTYHLASVVDDNEMKITNVIRAEEWLSSTPKHLILYEMLGWKPPQFAHLPLILNPDKSKMSKRYAATSVLEYKKTGYLPEALFNFIALLGWHPKDDREIFTKDDLIKEFELNRVQKTGAVFDIKKLDWMNFTYIVNAPIDRLIIALKDVFESELSDLKTVGKLLLISKGRMCKLIEFKEINKFFFDFYSDYKKELLIWKKTPSEIIKINLKNVHKFLEELPESEFNNIDKLKSSVMSSPLIKKQGVGETLWPLRIALSGEKDSQGPFEIMHVLSKKETLERIKKAIKKLTSFNQ